MLKGDTRRLDYGSYSAQPRLTYLEASVFKTTQESNLQVNLQNSKPQTQIALCLSCVPKRGLMLPKGAFESIPLELTNCHVSFGCLSAQHFSHALKPVFRVSGVGFVPTDPVKGPPRACK